MRQIKENHLGLQSPLAYRQSVSILKGDGVVWVFMECNMAGSGAWCQKEEGVPPEIVRRDC